MRTMLLIGIGLWTGFALAQVPVAYDGETQFIVVNSSSTVNVSISIYSADGQTWLGGGDDNGIALNGKMADTVWQAGTGNDVLTQDRIDAMNLRTARGISTSFPVMSGLATVDITSTAITLSSPSASTVSPIAPGTGNVTFDDYTVALTGTLHYVVTSGLGGGEGDIGPDLGSHTVTLNANLVKIADFLRFTSPLSMTMDTVQTGIPVLGSILIRATISVSLTATTPWRTPPAFADHFDGDLSRWTTSAGGGGPSTGVSVASSLVECLVEPGTTHATGYAVITTNESFPIAGGQRVRIAVDWSTWWPGSYDWYDRGYVGLINADTGANWLAIASQHTSGATSGPIDTFAHQGSDALTQAHSMAGTPSYWWYYVMDVYPTSATVSVYDSVDDITLDFHDQYTVSYDTVANVKIQIGAGNNGYSPWTGLYCDYVEASPISVVPTPTPTPIPTLTPTPTPTPAPILFDHFDGDLSRWTTGVSGGGPSTGVSVSGSLLLCLVEPNSSNPGYAMITTNDAFVTAAGVQVRMAVDWSTWWPGSGDWYDRGYVGLVNADAGTNWLEVASMHSRGAADGPINTFAHQGSDALTQAHSMSGIPSYWWYYVMDIYPTAATIRVYNDPAATTPYDQYTVSYDPLNNVKVQIGAGSNGYYPWTGLYCDYVEVSAIPEPLTIGFVGLAGLSGVLRRKH